MILKGIGPARCEIPTYSRRRSCRGIVAASQHPDFKIGDEVLVTGYRVR